MHSENAAEVEVITTESWSEKGSGKKPFFRTFTFVPFFRRLPSTSPHLIAKGAFLCARWEKIIFNKWNFFSIVKSKSLKIDPQQGQKILFIYFQNIVTVLKSNRKLTLEGINWIFYIHRIIATKSSR